MRACVIIPARYASSRYPGKPLVPLLGRPMVLRVADLSAKAVGRENVFVATDDVRIASVVNESGFTALMTDSNELTGTDRLAQAAKMVNYDIYVNVQGDEPLVDPEDIRRCIRVKGDNLQDVVNGFCGISADEDPTSLNIPKVVISEAGYMLYMSRALVPGFKDVKCAPEEYVKQVCIYGFTREELELYRGFGRKSVLEQCEDIEILRFLELGRKVLMFKTSPGSLAVDVPEDVERVENLMREKLFTS